ncbi:MAG: 3-methyl-2-oxobutanoate hydroxymethyltransferase [Actinobacteria bacterium]|nr:MAG: 3-methyl-2-oxobutanoate hydroxymethyltransferase [Actinomycetota bacterium]
MSVSILDLAAYKARGEKFVMLTAYDFPTAQILDEAGVPVLLVGDSLAQVVLGYDTTIPVSVDEMLHHTRAVARGARNALIVGDMPFGTYGGSVERGIENAIQFMKEGSAHAVKFEGPQMDLVEHLARIGVPVMAHLGLTPQSVHLFGGYKVQGRSEEQAENIVRWAKELEEAGAFSLVLECVPSDLAARITRALSIPTIGIGAGPDCDAQVLVINDLLGLTPGKAPKFVKRYANLRDEISEAAKRYADEVARGEYPGPEHSYS